MFCPLIDVKLVEGVVRAYHLNTEYAFVEVDFVLSVLNESFFFFEDFAAFFNFKFSLSVHLVEVVFSTFKLVWIETACSHLVKLVQLLIATTIGGRQGGSYLLKSGIRLDLKLLQLLRVIFRRFYHLLHISQRHFLRLVYEVNSFSYFDYVLDCLCGYSLLRR